MRFMGHTLTLAKDGESWKSDPKALPIIVIGLCIDGTWFGFVTTASRSANLQVHRRPSLRAAKAALEKQVRQLRASLESFE